MPFPSNVMDSADGKERELGTMTEMANSGMNTCRGATAAGTESTNY